MQTRNAPHASSRRDAQGMRTRAQCQSNTADATQSQQRRDATHNRRTQARRNPRYAAQDVRRNTQRNEQRRYTIQPPPTRKAPELSLKY